MENITEFLNDIEKKYANNIAVTTKAGTATYGQLSVEIGCIRGILVNVALPKDKMFAIFMGNSVDSVKTLLAITTLGHTAIIIQEDTTEHELVEIISKYDIGCIIFDNRFDEVIRHARINTEGCIFLTASNLYDEYVDAESDIDPDTIAVIMTTKDGLDTPGSYSISHRALINLAMNAKFMQQGLPYMLKGLVLLSVTRPLGLIKGFFSGIYHGANLYFCNGDEDMFNSMLYFRPDLLLVTGYYIDRMHKWLYRENADDGDAPGYIIIESDVLAPEIKNAFEKKGVKVFYEKFINDSHFLAGIENNEEK